MPTLAEQRHLPKLPGMTFGEEMIRGNYKKPQVLAQATQGAPKPPKDALNDFLDSASATMAPGATADHLQWRTSTAATNDEVWKSIGFDPDLPKTVSLERKVLCFRGFVREVVRDSALEQHRVRSMLISYHLEDDTISVTEPKQDNSGIPFQGSFIKRHQIPKPNGYEVFTYDDFNVGQEVTFYGRTFKLIDCDGFTRRFLEQLGKEVPGGVGPPLDDYGAHRLEVQEKRSKVGNDNEYAGTNINRTKLGTEEIAKTKQFLTHDKQVLHYQCIWDDRDHPDGDLRRFHLYYFLSDDTIEITEIEPPNCGRDPFPSFLKRGKVPRPVHGHFQNPTTSLLFKSNLTEYYTQEDVQIGATLQIFGRNFRVFDCDEYTKEYLSKEFGVQDFTPLDVTQSQPRGKVAEPPPHNGFGDEEDALKSWKHLLPSATARDNSLAGKEEVTLRFQVMFDNPEPVDAVRRFVLSFFIQDDTVAIFEPPIRNSGIVGGKFLNRKKVKFVGLDGIPTGKYLTASDFFVGSVIIINTHTFKVYGSNEATLQYMEHHPDKFPKSSISRILTKVRKETSPDMLRAEYQSMLDRGMGKADFRDCLPLIRKINLTEQENLTLVRYFDKNGDGMISLDEFCRACGM